MTTLELTRPDQESSEIPDHPLEATGADMHRQVLLPSVIQEPLTLSDSGELGSEARSGLHANIQRDPSQSEVLRTMLVENGYDKAEISANGDRGFIIELGEHRVGGDILASDLDDSLVAYTLTKEQRLEAMHRKAAELGLDLDIPTCNRVLSATDRFARWGSKEERYHIDAHKQALSFALTELHGTESQAVQDKVLQIEHKLDGIKSGLTTDRAHDSADPFYFVDEELITADQAPAIDTVEDIFKPMYEPTRYDDTLDTFVELGQELQSVGLNEVIFTYGEPDFQLDKVLRMLAARQRMGSPLTISQIWLTTVPKGEFVVGMANDATQSVKDKVFGGDVHSIVLGDDSPKELRSVLREKYNRTLRSLGVTLSVFRLQRGKTKYADARWDISSEEDIREKHEYLEDYRAFGRDDLKGTVLGALLQYSSLVTLIPRDAPDEQAQLARLRAKGTAYSAAYRQAYEQRWGAGSTRYWETKKPWE